MLSTRLLHGIHRWTGLISGINILILSLTGAYLVFHEELNAAFSSEMGEEVLRIEAASPTPVQDAIDALLAEHPGAMPQRVRGIAGAPREVEIALRSETGSDRYILDRDTGAVRTHLDGWMVRVNTFIFTLHATLFLGRWGSFVLGAVALVFFLSTITGCLIYAPFMKQMAYGALRRGRGWRKVTADLHKVVGVSSLAFNLLMAVTGIALTLGLVVVQLWSLQEVRTRTAGQEPLPADVIAPPMDAVIAAAESVHPGAPIDNVAYPGGYQGKNFYLVYHVQSGALTRYIPTLSLVPVADPMAAGSLEMPLWVKAIMVCFPLHFGNYAGIGMKLVYVVLGISSGLLSATGAAMDLSRRWNRIRARRKREGIDTAPELRPREVES